MRPAPLSGCFAALLPLAVRPLRPGTHLLGESLTAEAPRPLALVMGAVALAWPLTALFVPWIPDALSCSLVLGSRVFLGLLPMEMKKKDKGQAEKSKCDALLMEALAN